MNIQKNLNWLIVFFVHEIQQYVDESKELLKTIRQSDMQNHSEVWVLYEKFNADFSSSKGKYELIVYLLEVTESGGVLKKVPLSLFGISVYKKGDWVAVLTYLFQEISAERRILYTWSHGSGFGIHGEHLPIISGHHKFLLKEEVEEVNKNRNKPVIPPIELAPGEAQIVEKEKENEYDCAKAEVLWMSDLAMGLTKALNGKMIDFLIMMNCNTQLLENGYMIRDSVKILVGSESKMWVYGYDYSRLLQTLCVTPEICNESLAKSIVTDYVAKHKQLGHHKYLRNTTMFANYLYPYKNLVCTLQKTLIHLFTRWEIAKPVILKLRKDRFYSVSGREVLFLLDIKLWVDTIFKTPELAMPDDGIYKDFLFDLDQTVIEKHIGSEMTDTDQTGPKIYGASCAGLFFPLSTSFTKPDRFGWCEYFSRQRSSRFQNDCLWDEFLTKLLS